MKLSSSLRLNRMAPAIRVGIVSGALLITPTPGWAVEPVSAVVGVALTAVGMVVGWLAGNYDDVKVAAAALTSGDHQGHSDLKNDSGFSYADTGVVKVDDSHGNVLAWASAEEGFFGTTISGAYYGPYVSGELKPLEKIPDKHHIEGSAQASIDGRVEGRGITEGRATTPPPIGSDITPVSVDFNVFLDADSFRLAQPANLPGNASSLISWEFSQRIDGEERFYTSIFLNSLGELDFNYHDGVAGFSPDVFQLNLTADSYELTPIANHSENGRNYFVQTFFSQMVSPATDDVVSGGPVFAYDLSGVAKMATSATASVVPEPSNLSLVAIGLGMLGVAMRRRRQTRKNSVALMA